jgi:prophage maintenance system killer protein/DNA-binding MarR family transcriptional regulator
LSASANTSREEIVSRGEIVIYQAPDGSVALDVRLEQETIWLNLNQLATLLGRDKSVISRHLRNIFKEGELEREATVAKFATVQTEGDREVKREVDYYNLDAVISAGYRVNSKRGTQFRIWATRVLRDHILKGYTVNEQRLRNLNQAVKLIADTAGRRDLSGDEAKALLAIVGDYRRALGLLDDYDHQRVSKPAASGKVRHPLGYDEALRIVERLRGEFAESAVFGVEKDKGLASALGAIMQTAGGSEVYPSLEEKAANLLYFLVKNHAFVDGNKRIAAALFLRFLGRNEGLEKTQLSQNALVAMTLMIAESHPDERDILVRIVTHLLCAGDAP